MRHKKFFRFVCITLALVLTGLVLLQIDEFEELWDQINPFAAKKPKKVVEKTKVAMRTLEVYFFDWVIQQNT